MGLVHVLPPTVNLTILSGMIPSDTLFFIDTYRGVSVLNLTLPVAQMGNVVDIGYLDALSLLYIPNGIDTVYVYSIPPQVSAQSLPTLLTSYKVGNTPSSVTISKDGSTVYVTNAYDYSISVISNQQSYTVSLGSKISNTLGPLSLATN